jgi:dihydroorotate dehydrogenase (fumarate)
MDLTTKYLGLDLRSPIVVSACPLSENVDNIEQMEAMGVGAVVLFSLFEEQIRKETQYYESILQATSNSFPEATDYFPGLNDYRVGTDRYLELIREAKERVDIPIIASLNGISDTGWIEYAQLMEDAGADALEINVFLIPADISLDGVLIEKKYLDIVSRVKSNVSIPVAIKLNPYFSSMGHMARQLVAAGADGLVLFNRFYQPDFNIYDLKVEPSLEFSSASEIRLPLLWLSVLYGKLNLSLAATTGVQSASEVVKYLLAGADVTMTASALYRYGIGYLETMHDDLRTWMKRMGFTSVSAFKGLMSQKNISDPTAFERANYIRILEGV